MSVSGNRSPFALVLAADEGFGLPLAVAIRSALASLARGVSLDVYVLDNGLSPSSRARLLNAVAGVQGDHALHWLAVPAERLANVVVNEHLTAATHSRVFAPELVPEHVERVVYLDADVLVRRDISPLFTVDLGDAAVGAVRDFLVPTTAHELSGVRDLAPARPYFNAGLLVIDVGRWRESGLTDKTLTYARERGEALRFVNQDSLNGVVESWQELDYGWNVQEAERWHPSELADELYVRGSDLYRDAAVLHYVGGPKPWDPLCRRHGTTAWFRTMLRSGWYPPARGLAWLLRYVGGRVRYWLGTTLRPPPPRQEQQV